MHIQRENVIFPNMCIFIFFILTSIFVIQRFFVFYFWKILYFPSFLPWFRFVETYALYCFFICCLSLWKALYFPSFCRDFTLWKRILYLAFIVFFNFCKHNTCPWVLCFLICEKNFTLSFHFAFISIINIIYLIITFYLLIFQK